MDKQLKEQGIQLREKMYMFIVDYITENGYPPTMNEIGDAVGLMSKSNVRTHLKKLEEDGRIIVKPYVKRAIKVVEYTYQKV